MTLVAIILIIYLLFLVIVIATKTSRALVHWSLIVTICAIISWVASISILQLGLGDIVFFGRLAFLSGLASMAGVTWFLYEFCIFYNIIKQHRLIGRLAAIPAITVGFLTIATDLIIHDVNHVMYSMPRPEYGPLILVYFASLVMCGFISLSLMAYSIRYSTGLVREQTRIVSVAIIFSVILAVFTNLLLQLLSGNTRSSLLLPLAVTLLISGISYAIVRKSLFDIKTTAIRGLVYLLSLMTLTLVYFSLAYIISIFIFDNTQFRTTLDPVNVMLSLALVLIYQPVKKFFDKITNRIFYKQEYDIQETLNKISEATVEQKTVKSLSENFLVSINSALKCEFIFLKFKLDDAVHIFKIGITDDSVQNIITAMRAYNSTVEDIYVTDIYYDSDMNVKLEALGVGAIVQLKVSKDVLGYICLGHKSNGERYYARDVGLLKVASREFAVALQNVSRLEEISRFNSTLQEKVDNATRKLRATNTKLKMLDETKDDFMSMASHQLRTPLTSIKGYLSMLLEGDMGEVTPAQRKALEEAYGSSQRMVYLIGDFLNLSRLRTGRFELETSSVLLPTIIHQEIAQLRAIAHSRNVRLTYDSPIKFPSTIADETKIRQVMMNFIDNAIYYSKPDGGKVTVTLEVEKDDAVFTVVDSGIGVGEAEQSHLFTKFYRTPSARKARPDGTGVGLFMAKKVIDAHHGSIIFKSRENVGSTFGFRLPILDKK